jgi:hypothetical protein
MCSWAHLDPSFIPNTPKTQNGLELAQQTQCLVSSMDGPGTGPANTQKEHGHIQTSDYTHKNVNISVALMVFIVAVIFYCTQTGPYCHTLT